MCTRHCNRWYTVANPNYYKYKTNLHEVIAHFEVPFPFGLGWVLRGFATITLHFHKGRQYYANNRYWNKSEGTVAVDLGIKYYNFWNWWNMGWKEAGKWRVVHKRWNL